MTCYTWPLVGVPYCAAHDPAALERRRRARAAANTAVARGRALLTHTPPEILRGALEILLLSGRVTALDIETAVWRSRWLTDNSAELRQSAPDQPRPV